MRQPLVLFALLVSIVMGIAGCSKPAGSPSQIAGPGALTAPATAVPTAAVTVTVAGAIKSIAADLSSFAVGNVTIAVGPKTVYGGLGSPASLADLAAGDLVRVLAVRRLDGSLLALSVMRVESPVPGFSGRIFSIAAPNFVVGRRTVVTNANTQFFLGMNAATFADLKVGQLVTVRGALQPDSTFLASVVRVFVAAAVAPNTVAGAITEVAADHVTVGGVAYAANAATLVEIGGKPAKVTDLNVGMTVLIAFKPGTPPVATHFEAGRDRNVED